MLNCQKCAHLETKYLYWEIF